MTLAIAVLGTVCAGSRMQGETSPSAQKKQIVLVELGRKGFYPSTIEAKAGKEYAIYLRVVTEIDQPVSLQHTSLNGKILLQQNLAKNQSRKVLPLDITQGSFLIQDVNHPKCVLQIDVK